MVLQGGTNVVPCYRTIVALSLFMIVTLVTPGYAEVIYSDMPNGGWSIQWDGGMNGSALDIVLDGDNFLYVVGWTDKDFPGTVNFGFSNAADDNDESASDQGEPVWGGFLSKFTTGGINVWTVSWPAVVNQVALDADGNIYAAGNYIEVTDFDPNPFEETIRTGDDGYLYLSKFDSDGNFQWVQTWAAYYPEEIYGIEIGPDGEVYVIGKHASEWPYETADGTTLNADWFGGYDIFLARFDPDGNFNWVRSWGSDDFEVPGGVSVDNDGLVWICGTGFGEIDLDPGPNEDIFDYGLDGGVFITGLNDSGEFVTGIKWPATDGFIECNDIFAVDSTTIYLAGDFNGDFDLFNDGGGSETNWQTNSFIVNISLTAGFEWAKAFYSGDITRAFNVSTDRDGNVYVTGDFSGTVDFDTGEASAIVETQAESAAYLAVLDPDGELLRYTTYGDEGWSYVWGTAVDRDGNVYVTGDLHYDWPDPAGNLTVDRIYISKIPATD